MEAIRLFHDLGSIQHFQNENLKDKIVINPQWIIDVLSCLVSVHKNAIQVNNRVKL